jgi:hypothetical protein
MIPMKRLGLSLLVFAGAALVLLSGCAVHPTRANTWFAVDDYFQIGNTPYSILFGKAQPWGSVTAWPVRIYTLDYRDEFARKYPGDYFVILNEDGDWEVTERDVLREDLETARGR